MNESVLTLNVGLIVELVENVIVRRELFGNVGPKVNCVRITFLDGHFLLLGVVIVPVEVDDGDGTNLGELIDHLANHGAVLPT